MSIHVPHIDKNTQFFYLEIELACAKELGDRKFAQRKKIAIGPIHDELEAEDIFNNIIKKIKGSDYAQILYVIGDPHFIHNTFNRKEIQAKWDLVFNRDSFSRISIPNLYDEVLCSEPRIARVGAFDTEVIHVDFRKRRVV